MGGYAHDLSLAVKDRTTSRNLMHKTVSYPYVYSGTSPSASGYLVPIFKGCPRNWQGKMNDDEGYCKRGL